MFPNLIKCLFAGRMEEFPLHISSTQSRKCVQAQAQACITAFDHHNMANSLNEGIMHDTTRASLKISTYRESVSNTVSIMRSRDELLVPVLNKWPFVPQNTSIKDKGEMIVN